MAIAFARVSIHSRSKGHSTIAASSYRAGIKLLDSRTGRSHDYSNRDDVVYNEVLLPKDSNNSFLSRENLWNAIERAETRKNSQLCKDIVLALPKEISREHQIEITKQFAQEHFTQNGLPADIAIHDKGNGNPHAHILIPTRRLEGNKFFKHKARDLNPAFYKGKVIEGDIWSERWREFQNEYFIENNLDLTVDLNHIISERHHGKVRDIENHYLFQEKKLIQQARIKLTRKSIKEFISRLSDNSSVFTLRDVEKLLFKTYQSSNTPEEYLTHVEKVINHKEIVSLGKNNQNQECYTTRSQFQQEANLLNDIEILMCRKNDSCSQTLQPLDQKYILSDEQCEAFKHITQGPDISVVIGRPGTGKSYLLKPVNEYYKQLGHDVIGAALSGKVSKSLQSETGIQSSTLKSLNYRLDNNLLKLSNKHVVVIDEAGMIDFSNMSRLIKHVKKAKAKVILIGDPDQLKPIHKGEIFRGIAARTGYVEMENIKRQQDSGDRQASLSLAKGEIDKAITHYNNKGAISLSKSPTDAVDKLIQDWRNDLEKKDISDTVMLSFTRKAVRRLNDEARSKLITMGKIGKEDISYQGMDREIKISSGERVLFRQNSKVLGVRNGDTATVQKVTHRKLKICLDNGTELVIPRSYKALDYAYALTVHKSQGMTAKNVKVLIDSKYWDRNLSFVAMTRHKHSLKLYADRINHPNLNALKRTLSRNNIKDNVIDWPLDYATRRGFDSDSLIGKVVNHIAGVNHKVKQAYNFIVDYESYLLASQQKERTDSIKNARGRAKFKALQTDTAYNQELLQNSVQDLNEKHPYIDELTKLMDKRQKLSGYFAEKLDKQIYNISEHILSNRETRALLKANSPSTLEQIISVNKSYVISHKAIGD